MLNYFNRNKQIKDLKNQIEIIHNENMNELQQLKQLRLTAEQDIERVNEAGKRLYPEKYATRVIDAYQDSETRNNLI